MNGGLPCPVCGGRSSHHRACPRPSLGVPVREANEDKGNRDGENPNGGKENGTGENPNGEKGSRP